MSLTDPQVHGLLAALAETRAHELDCEEFLARMAQYAELRAGGQPVPAALADVEQHERLCANCREECQALVDVLGDDDAGL
jgi:hypothetical protein